MKEGLSHIMKEYKGMRINPIAHLGVTTSLFEENDYFHWRVSMLGAKDTSYRGGLFYLGIDFPDNYPEKAPDIYFITPIYHLNVNPKKPNFPCAEKLGHVSYSVINWWKPNTTIRELLIKLFAIFYWPNPDSPYGLDRADEFINNRALYEKKVKYFTRKYANPMKGCYKSDGNDWDFSFNEKDYKEKENNSNNKVYESNIGDKGELINISFEINGIQMRKLKCRTNEYMDNIIYKNFEDLKNKQFLAILNAENLNLKATIGEILRRWENNAIIIIIYDVIFA